MDQTQIIFAAVGGVVLLLLLAVACRVYKRNRYYKKVQHSLDEEERAFQETLARSYHEEQALDGADQDKLRMLDTYMQGDGSTKGLDSAPEDMPLPTRPEDIDRFMADLAAQAASRDT